MAERLLAMLFMTMNLASRDTRHPDLKKPRNFMANLPLKKGEDCVIRDINEISLSTSKLY